MWDKLENLNVYKKVKVSSLEMLPMIFSLLNYGEDKSVDKVKDQWMLGLQERSAGTFFK